MRKHQQNQILELLKTLLDAQSAGLYADCDIGARAISEFIESVKENTRAVKLLNEYRTLLQDAANGMLREKLLRKHLGEIKRSILAELKPTKTEIVFLSYKASMGDSIESIYLAAKTDPNCDAYWIPIPYYDLKPDGSLGPMRYEGAEHYSKEIACTHWKDYDFEASRPDAIFIFNPYDAGNRVTSVHPNFYCERLRKYTKLLVYVPYFVLIDDVPEHFCTLAGCIYAHRVIVQSEKVRETYVRVFKASFGNRYGRPEDKFVALGSPKYDKCIGTTRSQHTLPKEWQNLVDNKKVIFYNTSVGGILSGDEHYLKKLRYVLSVFRARNDVILWWRPHPLNEATYSGMRPYLLEEYKKIVEEYRNEGFGIYDDTADLHRALIWADAYYGDWSSLISMYSVTGKPIMVQNSDSGAFLEEYDASAIDARFLAFMKHENSFWFVPEQNNVFLKMDIQSRQIEFVGGFTNDNSRRALYRMPVLYEDRMILPPFLSKEICIYSICDNTFNRLLYHDAKKNSFTGAAFERAVHYNEYIYFTPSQYPAIMRLNMLTNEVEFFSDWLVQLEELIGDVEDSFFVSSTTVGNSIMLPSCESNAVVEFNMETTMSIVHEVGERGYSYNGICFDGVNCWLSPRHSTPIIKWNPKTGEAIEFPDLYFEGRDMQFAFHPIVFAGNHAWLLPRFSKYALKINTQNDVISIAEEFEPNLSSDSNTAVEKYSFAQALDNSIFTYMKHSKTFIEYNCETGELRKDVLHFSPDTAESIFATNLLISPELIKTSSSCIYHEKRNAQLQIFLRYITLYADSDEEKALATKRSEIARSEILNANGGSGQAIYTFINKLT